MLLQHYFNDGDVLYPTLTLQIVDSPCLQTDNKQEL